MSWFVAYTGLRQERRAAASLAERGIEAYVPCEKHLRSHARIKDTVERPILPRYLFFRLNEGQSFYTVKQTDGIDGFIGAGHPQAIPFEWVHEIRERERAGHFDYTQGKGITYANGEAVKIIGGPFAGMLATIMEAKPGAKRVAVFIKALGRLTGGPAKIAVGDLERAA
jgi:transcription antitermination factor NusG